MRHGANIVPAADQYFVLVVEALYGLKQLNQPTVWTVRKMLA